ncbi:FAD binding domain-containing protein [Tolypocladium paradoxum]|uniref:FAD binding domain-containing protein n=1 Tax=Tolypocladium paradoxum TaxID=94208 RepID=A0A2S4L0U3_9HYPO|nr:FAD binding domain-containing protein [Tolypocladium paradoxum]
MPQERFKVIIIGGSVTGLTLAHSLHQIGADYTILEKRPKIAPQEGASIGILPNGARVLDQLGLYDAIEQATAPLGATRIHFPDDFQFSSPYPKKMLEKCVRIPSLALAQKRTDSTCHSFGYPIAFLERRKLLEILFNALPEKTKVQVNKTVSDIEQYTEDGKGGIRVRTLDGDVYDGDLIVGADGVHSRTRSEMWRMSSSLTPNKIPVSERNCMSVEYSCVFGISGGISALKAGEQVMRIYNGRTLVVIPSKDELVFWFLVQKLDRKYKYGDAPRFTSEEAVTQCLNLADAPIEEGVRFGDVWQKRQTFNMVCLEENLLKTWSFGRLVCIGDSIHKMTVNLGQGANCAIEDVAVLSNLLRDCLKKKKDSNPTGQELDTLLRRFNHIHLSRVSQICSMSALTARVHARDGFIRKAIGRYIMPYFGERFEGRPFKMIADAAALDFLPLPRSSFPGWEKYRSKGNKIGSWVVVLYFLLLLIILQMVAAYRHWI